MIDESEEIERMNNRARRSSKIYNVVKLNEARRALEIDNCSVTAPRENESEFSPENRAFSQQGRSSFSASPHTGEEMEEARQSCRRRGRR